MALTKVSGPLLHGSNDNLGNYVVNNITGAAATFTGNVSVGGTLTYDDVTNVDSVGLITAQNGINVTGGSVRIGDTNTTANVNADNLVIGETTGNHGVTILSGQNAVGNLFFGDSVNSSAAGIQYFHTDNHVEFRVAGGEKIRFTAAGDVGIGTTNPYTTGAASRHKLTVAADDVLGIGRANIDMFYVRREYEAGKYTFQTINGGNAGNFNFQPFGGVVGIGTKTPATKLHVTTSSSSATPLTLERTHNNNVIVHYKNSTLSMYAGLAGEGLGWGVGDGADLGSTGNNQFMVTSAGRIGIGTIAPETNLTIAVNATNQTTATIPTVRLTNTDTTAVASDIVGSYEFFSKDTHSLNKVTGFMRNTPTDAGVNYDLTFGTIKTSDSNALERLRIKANGKVGIGSTVPTQHLDIRTGTHIFDPFIKLGKDDNYNPRIQLFRTTGGSPSHYGAELKLETGYFIFSNAAAANLGSESYLERIRIDSNGRLLISRSGLQTSKNVGTKTGEIQVASGGNNAAITLIGFSNDVPGPYLMLGKSRAGNASGNTIVQENDRLGEIAFCGADGNDIDSFGAAIKAWVDGTPGNNDMPGRLAFYTTGDGGASASERMVIKSDGDVGIGTDNPQAKLDVNGKIKASTGILFGSDTAAANTLDDYEEGSWTPTVVSGGNIAAPSYTCTYTKIGRLVTINADIAHLSDTTSNSHIIIGGLPYVPSGTGTTGKEFSAVCHGERYGGQNIIVAYLLYTGGAWRIGFRFGVPSGHFSYVKHSDISDDGTDNNLRFTLTYELV